MSELLEDVDMSDLQAKKLLILSCDSDNVDEGQSEMEQGDGGVKEFAFHCIVLYCILTLTLTLKVGL